VVNSLTTFGGDEHSLESITAALNYKLRPEAQRVVILITDEEPEMYFTRDQGIAKNLMEAQAALARESALFLWWGQRAPSTGWGEPTWERTTSAGPHRDITRILIDHVRVSGDSPFPPDGTRRIARVHVEHGTDVGEPSSTTRPRNWCSPPRSRTTPIASMGMSTAMGSSTWRTCSWSSTSRPESPRRKAWSSAGRIGTGRQDHPGGCRAAVQGCTEVSGGLDKDDRGAMDKRPAGVPRPAGGVARSGDRPQRRAVARSGDRPQHRAVARSGDRPQCRAVATTSRG